MTQASTSPARRRDGRAESVPGVAPPSKRASRKSSASSLHVSESFCIAVQDALQSLMDDATQTEVSFPASYDNQQRRYIHLLAQKYGLFSKSAGGRGPDRFVHVAKVKKNAAMEQVSLRLPPVSLSSATVTWFPPPVQHYMEKYPLSNDEGDVWSTTKGSLMPCKGKQLPPRSRKRSGAPLFQPLPSQGHERRPKKRKTRSMDALNLPVHRYRNELVDLVEKHPIVLVSGDTGCGKSTQIPQFLLDDALARGRGERTRIICTQPRRISAISLADRVKRERVGQDPKQVGHAIRFDSSFDIKRSKLIFCTTGTLLKWLNNDPLAHGFSHLILDEVHERDQFTDFLLILIKTSILKHRPDLKVILMSATIQVEKFAQYFAPTLAVPILTMVGGTNFPVTTLFLEDVVALVQTSSSSDSQVPQLGTGKDAQMTARDELDCPLCGGTGFANEVEFGTHVANCYGELRVDFSESRPPDAATPAPAVPVAAMGDVLAATLRGIDVETKDAMLASYLKQQDALRQDQAVDYHLLLQLLSFIDRTFPLPNDGIGAVLVFLPGWEEIAFMERALLDESSDASTPYEVVLLHSRLSAEEQRRAFRPPPRGKRKLVLSTNIAETSLTIADVVFVVDCGKSKQTHVLAATASSSFVMGLQTTWIAQANCVQRTGRAGRVRAGVCFRLFTKSRYETGMKAFAPPELLTTPLEELLLQLKLLQVEKKLEIRDAKAFLLEAMEPPSETLIDASIQRLKDMRALAYETEALTVLGWHLGRICASGVNVQLAKLLLWGHFFGCVDAMAQTTCTLSGYRDPFLSNLGMSAHEQRQVNASKQAFASNGLPPALSLPSDHFVLWQALDAYLDARVRSSWQSKEAFCARQKLHRPTLDQVAAFYKQLTHDLEELGISTRTQLVPVSEARMPMTKETLAAYLMALSSGMYPNTLISRGGGKIRNWTSKEKVKVKLDGSSIVAWSAASKQKEATDVPSRGPDWLVYHEMMQSERARLAKYGTKLPSSLFPALLMGSVETQALEEQERPVDETDSNAVATKWCLVLDEWLVFELESRTDAHWIARLRERLQAAFLRHLERLHEPGLSGGPQTVARTHDELRQHDVELVQALVAWISSDLR
ncbi:hypothetical protein PsorP6_005276 [Peronosclerospora sorghi]|uniref:Uncharacterized protein n=1 Tax=Peronosclerospora sorghi TaxID=230839 RepID=A0ACC0W4Z2_9STRA|nr:hypothetical protein PsorP6_005276 [Peronosclerospora sorghi]